MSLEQPEPKILLTDSAARQIQVIKENDFTLEGLDFRIKIDGKGCDGFTYSTGFGLKRDDDILLEINNSSSPKPVRILIDPFSAYYVRSARLDYIIEPDTHNDGFVIINDDEENYHGKFFKDESMVPNHLEK
jgi:iron-sulfur cluster insertion protein